MPSRPACRSVVRGDARLSRQSSGDRVAIEALLADHHKPARARLIAPPRPVEMVIEPRSDALDEQTHRAALDLDEALHAQDVVIGGDRFQPLDKAGRIFRRGDIDDERVEIVVIVPLLRIMMRRALGKIVLGRGGKAEQDVRDRSGPSG